MGQVVKYLQTLFLLYIVYISLLAYATTED